MAEAVILSVIEKLDSWLLKKADFRVDDKDKLSSLLLEKADHPYSLVVAVAELWEDDKEMLYSFLVRVAYPLENMEVNVYSLLIEMADFWEDDDKGNIDKKRLEKLLVKMTKPKVIYRENFYKLVAKIADWWNGTKGKMSKEKLFRWLENKADRWDHNELFRSLQDMIDSGKDVQRMKLDAEIRRKVKEVKNDLRVIVNYLSHVKKTEDVDCFISGVAEMAQDELLLIQVMGSDPFILLVQIFMNHFIHEDERCLVHRPLEWLLEEAVSIQKSLQETKQRLQEFKVDVGEEFVGPTYSGVVGLEEDLQLVISRINLSSTWCIWGMSCIGKTTLAKILYNHPKIVDGHECRAWVCLSSRKLSPKELLIELIRQLEVGRDHVPALETLDEEDLQEMLEELLEDRRYFVVLDDVSDESDVNYVVQALENADSGRQNGEGKTLLFTTRRGNMKIRTRTFYQVHKLKTMDEDRSWQLVLKTALFESRDKEFPKHLEKKGRQMVMKKCGGMPLAIKKLGRYWAEKNPNSDSEWEQVVESSVDFNLGATIMELESIYYNLYPRVKSCFLRLAFFKEGTTIRENKLKQIWTAGGLKERRFQDNLSELADKSIIEVKNKTIHLNPFFHSMSIRKAEDEIDFEIRKKDGRNQPFDEPRQHRVVHCGREKFDYSTDQDKHLVSLFFHGGGYFDDTPPYWNDFEQLMILDIEDFGLKTLPEAVGKLSQLRYLGLRSNYIKELPHSLGRLKKLEVLDIAHNFMVEVGDIIWEMDSLRHLYMSDISCRKPLKIDALKYLETLTYISVMNWTYDDSRGLQMLSSLHRLGIEEMDENSDVSKLFASLAVLNKLKCLILRGFRFRSMPSLDNLGILRNVSKLKLEGRLTRLPSAKDFPPNLYYLSLVNSCLDEDPIPVLENLPNLLHLELQNTYTGQQMVISPNGFWELTCLVIRELWHLRKLQLEYDAVQSLMKIEIKSCPYVSTIMPYTQYHNFFTFESGSEPSRRSLRNRKLMKTVKWDISAGACDHRNI